MYIHNSIGIIKTRKTILKKEGGGVHVYKCKYIVGDSL